MARKPQPRAHQIIRISRAQFPHGFGAVTLERPRTDVHPEGSLLVRATLADQVQNLALALGQGPLAGIRVKRFTRSMENIRLAANTGLRSGSAGDGGDARVRGRDLLDQSA